MSNLPHTVKRTVVLDAPAARVWEALTDEALLGEWLAPEVELEPRAGGEVRCRFEDGSERRGEVELVDEAERLTFRWWREDGGPSRVELVLDAVGQATRLTLVETRLTPAARLLEAAWAPRLRRLRLALGRLALA